MASNGDENPPMSYGIAVGVSMPARVYDTLLEALELLQEQEESYLAKYNLLKDRIEPDRLLPQEVNAQRGLELSQEAKDWLQWRMQGLDIPNATPLDT